MDNSDSGREAGQSVPRASVKWLRFFSHPAVGIAGSIASVVGVALAIYFYRASISERSLMYYFHPIRTPVVQAKGLSDVEVTFRGQPIGGALTAAQVTIWNSGKEPIKSEDVLEEATFSTKDGSAIVEAVVRSVSREATVFRLDTTKLSSGRVGMTWRILEHNDGALVQILYAGPQETGFVCDGTIIGQGHPKELEFSGSLSTLQEQYEKHKRESRGLWTVALVALLVTAINLVLYLVPFLCTKGKGDKKALRDLAFDVLCGIVVCLIMFVAAVCRQVGSSPPFGF